MCTQKKDSHIFSFGLGALLGVGAGFFLSTKKGRRLAKQLWKQVEPYIEDVAEAVDEELDEVKEKADKLKSQVISTSRLFQNQDNDVNIEGDDKNKQTIKRLFFKGTKSVKS